MKMSIYLPMLLLLALAPAASAQDWGFSATEYHESLRANKLVQKVYSVADLVIPIDSANMRACALPDGAAPAEQQNPTVYAKHLMKLLNMVKPESWEACGGCGKIDYYPIGHALIVQQTPEVQQQVADLLASLRKLQDTQVVLEIRFVRVSPELPERLGLDLPVQSAMSTAVIPPAPMPAKNCVWNDKQVEKFLEAVQGDRRSNVMQAPKLTVLNGQTARMEVGETKYFLTGVKVEACKGQLIYHPENKPHFLGTRCEVQAVASENGKAVALRFKATIAEEAGPATLQPLSTMVDPVAPSAASAKPVPFTQFIQKPRIETIEVARTATIPTNATLVLPAGTFSKVECCESSVPVLSKVPYINQLFKNVGYSKVTENIVVLVTPRIIVVAEEEPTASLPDELGEFQRWITQRQQVCPDPRARFAEAATLPCPIPMPVREAKSGSCMTGVGCTSSSGMTGSICENVCPTPVARYYPGGFHALHGMSFRGAGQEMSRFNTCGSLPWLNSIEYQCPVMASDRFFFVSFLDAGTVAAPACCQPKSAVMNLADVVALSTSGVSEDVIVNQIHTTGATFTLCTEDILFLKKNHVSDKVVMHMQETRPKQPTPVYPPATVQPMLAPAYPPQPYAPTQYVPAPLPPTPAQYSTPWNGPVPLSVPYSCPLKLNGAYPPAMPSCPPMTAPSPTTVPYSHGSTLPFTPLRKIDSNGFERIGVDFGPPAPATPKPVSLDFGFPFPLKDVRGTIIINERNADNKRAQSKQAGEIGEEILGAAAELIDGVATFTAEDLPAFFSDAGENLNPKVTLTVGVGVKFGKDKSTDPNERMRQLLNESENLRQMRLEKARFWGSNQRSVLDYERLNGAIGPK